MKEGKTPFGPDGKRIELHHMTQRNESALAEVKATFHRDNKSTIHINPNTMPSGIDRSKFATLRKNYWINRFNDFK